MNYLKLNQKYFLILLFFFITFQSSFSQTINPPFQEVPVPFFPYNSYNAFFDINATGDWLLYYKGGTTRGTGNSVFSAWYQQNQSPNPTYDTLKLYDATQIEGNVSSVTVTPNIITFPPNATPEVGFLQSDPYFFGNPLIPSYISARFQQVSGNDYEIIVDINEAGLGYTEAQYPIRLVGGGSNASIGVSAGSNAIFTADENGNLVWNTAVGSKTLALGGVDGEVQSASGAGYFAPPNVTVSGFISLSGLTGLSTPVLEATVSSIDGQVTSVTILPTGGFVPGTEYNATINIVASFVVDVNAIVHINNPSTNLTPVSTAILSQLGNNEYYSVTGKVFRDANGNQVQDSGEEGIAGISIDNSNNFPNSYAFTDSEGNYRLNFLRVFGNSVTFLPRITEATPASRTVTLSATNPISTGNNFAVSPTGGRVGGVIISQNGERIAPNQNYNYQILLDNPTNSSKTISASFTPDIRFKIVSSSLSFDGNIPATFSVEVPAYSTEKIDIVLKTDESLTDGQYIRHYLEINSSTGRYNEQAQITQQIDENLEAQSLNLSLLSTPSLTQEEISSDKVFTYHIYKGNNAPAETAYTEMVIYLNEDADMSKFELLQSSLKFSNVEVSDSKTLRLKLNGNPSEAAPFSFLFNLISEQNDLRVYVLLNYYNQSDNLISSDISSIITTKVDTNPKPQQLIGIFKTSEGAYLNWVANDGFLNFVITRKSENETEFKEVAQIGGSERNWLDTQVSPTTTYTYKVMGKKNATNSSFSNEVTIKTDETITALEEKQSNRIILYPNPSENSIHFKGTNLLSISHIEIVDLLGNTIIKSKDSSNLDISQLKSGMYVVRFVSKNGIFTKTFCKI